MTPAINLAKQSGISYKVHEYQQQSSTEGYGLQAAQEMGVAPQRVFKTLVVMLDNKTLAVGIVPVSSQLNMKLMAGAVGAKKSGMAAQSDVQRSTGYVLGGVSPLGQKKRLSTVIDSSARQYATIFVSAGRRGLELELSPQDLVKVTSAIFAGIC
jgi:Cys-tRNA(Pro)/Cys-tRNA(Cys) deacylase